MYYSIISVSDVYKFYVSTFFFFVLASLSWSHIPLYTRSLNPYPANVENMVSSYQC
jgi:hypothetical protein